jgi:formate-dependent nitrite reductase membrane component NrfD
LSPGGAAPRPDYLGAEQVSGVGHFAHLTERLVERTGGAPGNLTKLLAIAEQEADADRKATPTLRAYDAPQKGVLWDWEVAGYVWTKSIASGVLFLPLLLNVLGLMPLRLRLERGMALSALVFLAFTGVLLVKDLDQPRRFLSVLLRPQWRSWLVRGAYILLGFGACISAWALHLYFGQGPVLGLRIALVAFGALAAVYTAFLFAQAKGRDLWQSALLPVHMLVTSAMTGGAAVLLLALFAGLGIEAVAQFALAAAIVVHLGILLIEFTLPHVTADTRTALGHMTHGALRVPFWSALVLGNIVPLALLLVAPAGGISVFPACVLVLTFAFVTEHVWVRAPQLVPLR